MLEVRDCVNCILIRVNVNYLFFSIWKIIETFGFPAFLSGLVMAPVFMGFRNRALNIY